MPRQKLSKEEREATGKKAKTNAPSLLVVPVKPIVKPLGMSKEAGKLWDQIFPELIENGLLSLANAGTMADYCEIEVQKQAYRKKFQNSKNHTTKHSNGTISSSVDNKIYLSLSKESTRLADVLGISPSARRKLNILLSTGSKDSEGGKGKERVSPEKRAQIFG